MLPFDQTGKSGPKKPLPDAVSIVEPKDEETVSQPYSEQKGAKPADVPPQQQQQPPAQAQGPPPQQAPVQPLPQAVPQQPM